MPVYLLHFDQPYKHARHYIGWAKDGRNLKLRLRHHENGNGAHLLKVCLDHEITWKLAKVWDDGDRSFERRLKNRHGANRFCPICKGKETQTNDPCTHEV